MSRHMLDFLTGRRGAQWGKIRSIVPWLPADRVEALKSPEFLAGVMAAEMHLISASSAMDAELDAEIPNFAAWRKLQKEYTAEILRWHEAEKKMKKSRQLARRLGLQFACEKKVDDRAHLVLMSKNGRVTVVVAAARVKVIHADRDFISAALTAASRHREAAIELADDDTWRLNGISVTREELLSKLNAKPVLTSPRR